MESDNPKPVNQGKLIDLTQHRKQLENPVTTTEEDLDRLDHIYSEIQKLHNPTALKAATIGCRTAQALIAKNILS